MSLMSDELKRTLGILQNDSPEAVVDGTDGLSQYLPEKSEPAVFELEEIETSVPDLLLSDAKIDYVMARNHTYTILSMTTSALANALKVATETEHPRAFESFNSLAATARNLTLDLLALQKTFKEITKDREELLPAQAPAAQTEAKAGAVNVLEMLKQAIANGEITPMGEITDGDKV